MDKREAKFILAALRDSDSTEMTQDHAKVEEALRMVELDDELQRWYQEIQAFDNLMRNKLGETIPPGDLKSDILTAIQVSRPSRSKAKVPMLLIAASVLVFAGFAFWYTSEKSFEGDLISVANYHQSMLVEIDQLQGIDLQSSNAKDVTSFLDGESGPLGINLADRIGDKKLFGCKVFDWGGHRVTLICFSEVDSDEPPAIHLMVIDATAIQTFRNNNNLVVESGSDWASTVWQKGDYYYFLAAKDPDDLNLRNQFPYS